MNPELLDLPQEIETARLHIRTYRAGDAEEYARLLQSNREHLHEFMPPRLMASQRVAERCGFRKEVRLRQRNRKKNGELVDRLWYGLLRSEWKKGIAPAQA